MVPEQQSHSTAVAWLYTYDIKQRHLFYRHLWQPGVAFKVVSWDTPTAWKLSSNKRK